MRFTGCKLCFAERLGWVAKVLQGGGHRVEAVVLMFVPKRAGPVDQLCIQIGFQPVMRGDGGGAEVMVGGVDKEAGVDPAERPARGHRCGGGGFDDGDMGARPRQPVRKGCAKNAGTDNKNTHFNASFAAKGGMRRRQRKGV